MRALQRPLAGPTVLGRFRHGHNVWDDLSGDQRAEVWAALQPMQGGLCAYCEGSLDALGRHIDHHLPRARSPQLTFAWSNLLGSCARTDSCGHFKDSNGAPAYQLGDLIDPSAEDPDQLLVIRDSGRVEPRPGLSGRDLRRAERTIAALNLNLGWKVAERARRLSGYLRLEPDILAALAELPDEDRAAYIAAELRAVRDQPYSSVVRHFFTT